MTDEQRLARASHRTTLELLLIAMSGFVLYADVRDRCLNAIGVIIVKAVAGSPVGKQRFGE